MSRKGHQVWRLAIAVVSLSLAISVYCFARFNPPEILSPFVATYPELASFGGFFGSAPAFFYTLSLGLFIGACASNSAGAIRHCLAWIGLCLALELTQLPEPAAKLSDLLSQMVPDSMWRLIGPFWQRGVFDPIDLLATLAGGLLALALIVHFDSRRRSASR